MYIISKDKPSEQLELYNALEEKFGFSLPLVSDPEFKLIDHMEMQNGEVAYRGYSLIDKDGKLIFKTVNDHWGEEYEKTYAEIKEQFEKLNK